MIDTSCISVLKFNATSIPCDGKMSHRIVDLLDNTNYTTSLMVWNAGGHSDESFISVVTQLAPGEPLLLLIVIIIIIVIVIIIIMRKIYRMDLTHQWSDPSHHM